MKKLTTILIFIVQSSCTNTRPIDPIEVKSTPKVLDSESSKTISESIKNCICPQMWMPVCGDNGKTYSNTCFAKCAQVKYQIGSCEKTIE